MTPHEQASKKIEEVPDAAPPPYLSKALGVQEKPRKGKMSREEWRANLLSKKKRIDERRHLCVPEPWGMIQSDERGWDPD